MSTHLAGIRRAIAATAWAIAPDKGAALLEVVGLRASGARLSDAEIEQRIGAARDALTTRREAAATRATGGPGAKIAVLPLYGVISHRMNLMADISGGTSTEQFAAQFDAAVNDPSVSAIVLDIDSPGGSIAGVPELAKKIFDAQGKKPIVAVCNALMASAAYWIGSAADEIVITPSGEAGSIGVFCVHEDISQAAADAGVKFTIVKAGKYKAEGNPYEPLSDEAKAALQASVDDAYEQFVGAVAKHRGVKSASVKAGFGQGRCLPAQASVDAGLCDRVATLESVLADLGAKKGFGRSVASASSAAPARAAATTTLGTTGGVTIHVEPMLDAADARQMDALAHAIRALADRNIVIRHADLAPSTEPGDEPGADEAALCPNCGAPLDADGDCPACGWEAPGPDPDEAPEGAPAALDSPSSPAPEAKEHTVSTNPTAATNGAAPDANSVLLAERERVKELRAIAQSNGVDAATLEAWEHAGTSAKDAAYEVSKKKQAARAASPDIRVGADREAEKPFKTAGEQLFAIMQSARGRTDKRLLFVNEQAQRMAGTPSGMNESVGAEGGFFIQHDLLPGIIDPVYTEDPILSRVQRIPIGANSNGVKYNVVDETARTTGSRWGGIQGYWVAEADQGTASKPKLRQLVHDLKKLMFVAYLTDELMQDAPAAESLMLRAIQAELSFMLADSIFRGTGAGQPLGFMKSNATVTQAIEATQTIANSAQFLSQNIAKMLSRIPSSLWGEVIWLYNQELLPYLVNATVGSSTTVPVFMQIGGLSQAPQDTILGRPAFGSELCEAVGTPGDLIAVVPSQYHMADKGGAQTAQSLHVRFLYDETALRVTYRVDGQPLWKQTVTPYKGANARSPFVMLNTRA